MPDRTGSVQVDGDSRTFHVHEPAGLERPAPLVFLLHGRRLTVAEMRQITSFDAVADRHGFLAVYPEGYEWSWNDLRGDTPAERAGMDDVAFIDGVIEQLTQEVADPERVAVAGLSNGGCMAHRLGLQLSSRISCVAAVAGSMPISCAAFNPTHAVSALLMHGSRDPVMGMDGKRTFRGRLILAFTGGVRAALEGRLVLSLTDTFARWQAIDACRTLVDGESTPRSGSDPTTVRRSAARDGVGGTEVESWAVLGGGHTWPGGQRMIGLGRTTRHFDAGEEIWRFVSRQFRPAAERRLGGDAIN